MINGKQVVALCLPGDHFSSAWVASTLGLYAQMAQHYVTIPLMGYSSAVYVTRQCMAQEVLKMDPKPDLVMWVDDDNLITFEQFQRLHADLEYLKARTSDNITLNERLAVGGWCWIQADVHGEVLGPSAGTLDAELLAHPLSAQLLSTKKIVPVDYTGFPAVLMTRELLECAGDNPFVPMSHPDSTWGALGEDVSFCVRTRDRGARWFIDTSVEVPHLKLRAVKGPSLQVVETEERAA